ncbi:MAG: hypothetical protein M3O36_07985 [Myxococcota bacterium]|nr:hypothetical protein [Myxococcota bacterium]
MANHTKPVLPWPSGAGALLSAIALGGCSLLFHADADQCTSTAQCSARGSAFANHVCQAGTCVAAVTPVREAGVDASDDSGRVEEAAPPPDAAGSGCKVAADCTAASASHSEVACDIDSHSCVQLTTDECPLVVGDYSGATWPPVFIGAFATLPPGGIQSHPSYLNYRLAIEEFTFASGIPVGPSTGQRMPVAVVCNVDANVDTVMGHLVTDVHVPAVVAPLDSARLKTMFIKDAQPNKVFVINPYGADSTLTSLPTDQLLWHMLGQPSDNAAAYGAVFSRLEAYVRSSQSLAPSTPIRLATVTANATVTQDLAAAVLPLLRWNGQTVDQNQAAGSYQNVVIDSTLNGTPLAQIKIDSAVSALAAFKPNLVLSFAATEFVIVVQTLETPTSSNPTPPKPFYLVGPYNMASTGLLNWINSGGTSATEAKRTRVAGVGVAAATDKTVLHQYENRFIGRFNDPASLGQENFYDAMYFAVDSLVASGRVANRTGANVAQGMLRLLSGSPYNMGPSDMGSIFGALGAPTGTIRLLGALGPPDFTLATGARVGQGSIYCVARNPDLNTAYAYDVLTLAATDGGGPALGGTFSCYSGF